MRNIGEYIIYRKDVCKIVDIKTSKFNNMDYYVLEPISDKSLHIDVPVNNKANYIRDLISKEQVDKLIDNIPSIDLVDEEDRKLENRYKELLDSGKHENFVRIIKTAYLRNKNRIDNKKKISERDKHYFDLAEHYLYSEISVVLNMSYEDAKQYIVDRLKDVS